MKDLKKIAPNLSKMKKENPFDAPNHYFDDFSARLQTKLGNEENNKQSRKTRIISMIKPVLGLAASFVLIILLVQIPLKTFMSKKDMNEKVVVNSEESQLQNMLEHMDESVLWGLLENNDSADTLTDADLMAYVNTNFSSYEIFEYTEN